MMVAERFTEAALTRDLVRRNAPGAHLACRRDDHLQRTEATTGAIGRAERSQNVEDHAPTEVERVWSVVLERLSARVDESTLEGVVRRLQPLLLTDREMRLLAPSRLSLTHLTDDVLAQLRQCVTEVVGAREIVIGAGQPGQGELFPSHGRTRPVGRRSGSLNPRYTFETFVVGASNQFAHAASKAVAARPGNHYNPLFVYGGVGLGKTHLVSAIATEVLRTNPEASVAYLSSEEFTTELISSIRRERMDEFKRRFRAVDVLIVDDVQFMAGRDRTQEEFFHTFTVLHSAGRQIVLTSDLPPSEIRGLEERLRNRFEWGLIADIQPPDLETRVAIAERKAEIDEIPLDEEAAMLIAQRVSSNVRELEGVLTRLGAQASLAGKRVTVEFVQEALAQHSVARTSSVTPDLITQAICEHFNIEPGELRSRRRSHHVAMPRQLAMYLCRRHLGVSYPRIGELFDRDHSTVIHAVTTTEARIRADAAFHEAVIQVERILGIHT